MKKIFQKKEYIFAFLGFVALWVSFSIKTKAYMSGFHLTDDYAIFQISDAIKQNGLWHTLVTYMSPELFTRLRPLYTPFKILRTAAFGTHYTLWAAHLLVFATISSFLLYVFAKLSKFSTFESILLPLFTLLGAQSLIWFHLSYDETLGIMWMSISLLLLAISVNWEKHSKLFSWLFVIAAALMSMCKESFILMLPAFAYLKYYLQSQKSKVSAVELIKKDYSAMVLVGLFILSLVYLKFGVKTLNFGYCGISGFDPLSYCKMFSKLGALSNFMNVIVAATLVFCLFCQDKAEMVKKFVKENLHVFVIFLLIVLPQCVIYAKSDFYARYLLPSMLGYALLTVSVLKFYRLNLQSKIKNWIIGILIVLSLSSMYINANKEITKYSKEGLATQSILNIVKQHPQSAKVVIVGNPPMDYERMLAFKFYLNRLQNKNNVYYLPILDKKTSQCSAFEKQLTTQFDEKNNKTVISKFDKNADIYIVFGTVKKLFIHANYTDLARNFVGYEYKILFVCEKKKK